MENFILNYLNNNYKKSNLRTCSTIDCKMSFDSSKNHLSWNYSSCLIHDYELRFVLNGTNSIEIKRLENSDLIKKLLEIFQDDIFDVCLSEYHQNKWLKRATK